MLSPLPGTARQRPLAPTEAVAAPAAIVEVHPRALLVKSTLKSEPTWIVAVTMGPKNSLPSSTMRNWTSYDPGVMGAVRLLVKAYWPEPLGTTSSKLVK